MEVFEIETERLQLRQFRVEDAQDVFAIFSDEQTTLDCGGYHAFDAMDEEYDRLMQKFAGQTRYSVVRKADGRVIGVISLMDAERAVPGWELGIEMAPDVRRQGYAREALAAVIQAFFEKTDTVLFTGGHYAYNTLDQNAILGSHPDLPSLVLCNGFSGHGLQQAPAVGRGIAEQILHGGWQSLDLGDLSVARVLRGEPLREAAVV